MSMVQELIAAVAHAERNIDQQIEKLNSYRSRIDAVAERIESALSGSQQEYNRRMLDQLLKTRAQVDSTLASLQVAKEKLLRIRMI